MNEAIPSTWQAIAARKRSVQSEAIAQFRTEHAGEAIQEVLTVDDVNILAEKLRNGVWAAEQVITTYALAATEAQAKTNCLTEIIFREALGRARELDARKKLSGSTVGPLHGVPVTLKDQFDVKGFDSTLGYVARSFQPAEQNSVLVDILESMGAIVFAKTNLPQSIMWCETENPLWGVTTHPLDSSRTPGGSSGGEAALLMQQASILGFGTDLGGSIRMPSCLTGIYGLKPSSGRIPYIGAQVSTEGQEHIPSVIGPMARSLESITSIMRLIAESEPWALDPRCVCIPWREEKFRRVQSRPLTIGILADDLVVRPHPPIERHLKRAVTALKAAGHIVVPWIPEDHGRCVEIMDKYYTVDGGEDIRRAVSAGGEPFVPHVEAMINRGQAIPIIDYWALNRQKLAVQKAYLDRWHAFRSPKGTTLDVLLMPTLPHCAVSHRKMSWVGYTKVWNFLDYSALSFPVGSVDKTIDHVGEHSPRNAKDQANWALFDPEAMDGFPVSLQVVGRKHDEEVVLGAATVIEAALRA